MRAHLLDGGAYARTAFSAINKTATAGSTGDATEVDGAYFDRKIGDAGIVQSAKLVIAYTATLGDGATLAFAVQFQDAASVAGAGLDDFGDAVASTVVATGNSGGSTEVGTVEVDIDLSGVKQFVRAQITPNLSAANTDTCEWSAVYVLFGQNRQPSTQAIGRVEHA